MLFNLAATIGLEAEQSATVIREDSVRFREVNPDSIGLSAIREIREHFKPEFVDNANPAANDDGLPKHHYRGEKLVYWMTPTAASESMQLKQGDSAWIEAKLRRVPASRRKSLVDEYSARYKAAYDAEPDKNKKANRAAFVGNTWLLMETQ